MLGGGAISVAFKFIIVVTYKTDKPDGASLISEGQGPSPFSYATAFLLCLTLCANREIVTTRHQMSLCAAGIALSTTLHRPVNILAPISQMSDTRLMSC